jgi:hypothetical protein
VGIIAPQTRTTNHAWRCELVATERGWQRLVADRPQIADAELERLATTVRADPRDAETYAMLWQTRIRQRYCGGHTPAVARVIAEALRVPGTLTAELDLSALTRMIHQTQTTPPGLLRILARLAGTGHLTGLDSAMDESAGRSSAWAMLSLPA